jgi:hypothetical protein
MAYSYFPTQRSAEKWVRENLDPSIGRITIERAYHEIDDRKQWLVNYYLRAIK